jgi:hypothetical protein
LKVYKLSKMQCIQKAKSGHRCTNQVAEHLDYEGYCKYHINRFIQKKDIPDPVHNPVANEMVPPIPPINNIIDNIPPPHQVQNPARPPRVRHNNRVQPLIPQLPMIRGIPILEFNENDLDAIINFNLEERLRIFVNNNRDRLLPIANNKDPQEQDMLLFDIIVGLDQDEQNFVIGNYERLIQLINQMDNNLPPLEINNQIRNNQGVLVNAILAAMGLNAPREPPARKRGDDLSSFVNDTENVHTKEVVNPVLETAKKLIKYASKISPSQDTFKEVIYECKLSDNARKQLAFMYYSTEKIYNLKEPTYRLVLDGLWYYIKDQKENIKKDIIFRLSQELEDNYGTCPAGNLSRLINVLSGFMEGVANYEESVQDSMARISKIKDKNKKMEEALNLLKFKNVPKEEWDAWLEALEE